MDRQQNIEKTLADLINESHVKEAGYFNSKLRDRRGFNVGEQVWLIRPKRVGGNKTSTWWTGPYPIVKRTGTNTYVLRTSPSESQEAHSDQLKRYQGDIIWNQGIPMFYSSQDPKEQLPMIPERIRDKRHTAHGWEFLVHWKGAPNADDTWEPPQTFLHISSPVWHEYCKEQGLTNELLNIPVNSPAKPIFYALDP